MGTVTLHPIPAVPSTLPTWIVLQMRARDWLEAFVSKVVAHLTPSDQSCSGGRKLPFSCVPKLCHLLG